ncbi:MAG: glycoside hydrolase family 2 protein [Clostridia bacterium]|nr:glycoside hydrolase family 2 protein [Clostridia bacterium]
MKKLIRLNNDWLYNSEFNDQMISQPNLEAFHLIQLPHTNIELPYNYFDENVYQFISCYIKTFTVEEEFKRITIYFDGVMVKAEVYVNGHFIGEHLGGYTPFEFDFTEVFVKGENTVVVKVDSRELEDIPPFGGQIDYLTYGGIYREVSLNLYDIIYMDQVKVETLEALAVEKSLKIDFNLEGKANLQDIVLKGNLLDQNQNEIIRFEKELSQEKKQSVILSGIQAELWSVDSPVLYTLELKLQSGDQIDTFRTKIGFRTAEFKPDGFYLNQEKLQLIGLNRHQSFPYVGYAMPWRAQKKDADILKNELHVNIVRTSHYPQSKAFLERCDEIGLLVFEELPGWQHVGDDAWQKQGEVQLKEMIQRDWNHPSIVIWGVRINESQDYHDFYTRTNLLVKNLDATRATGGVRYIDNSELLEDVYTMNDFVHDGGTIALRDPKDVTGLEANVPYLVTEYNGHMYPTKRFDQEERQIEHVLRHLRVQNEAFKNPYISGAIGWCMFDYNTHKDFGSGDRICYHGVMDMFRIPKFASDVYSTQISPYIKPILKPVTFWARGERSIGGVLPLLILTNCDYVTLTFGKMKTFKIYPTQQFDALPYKPILVDESVVTPEDIGSWGMMWEDGLIKGFVDDQEVIQTLLSSNPLFSHLDVKIDDEELSADEKDVTRVVIKALDQHQQLMPFFDCPIQVEIDGPGRIIGPKLLNLKGGAVGLWIETKNQTGKITFTVDLNGEKISKYIHVK